MVRREMIRFVCNTLPDLQQIVGTAIITGLSSDDFSSLRWTEDRCRQFVGETA